MAVDEHNRDVVEALSGEQRRPRAVLPGLPRLQATTEAFESGGALPGVFQDAASESSGEHLAMPCIWCAPPRTLLSACAPGIARLRPIAPSRPIIIERN